jgi:hypothetical protein
VDTLREAAAAAGTEAKHRCRRCTVSRIRRFGLVDATRMQQCVLLDGLFWWDRSQALLPVQHSESTEVLVAQTCSGVLRGVTVKGGLW